MEARLAKADAPLFALGGARAAPAVTARHGGPGGGRISFDAAATYIGVTSAELRTQLEAGKSLATIATDNGKTADGLKAALTTAAKTDLDAAVTAGTPDAGAGGQAPRRPARRGSTTRSTRPTPAAPAARPAARGGPPPADSSSTAPAA